MIDNKYFIDEITEIQGRKYRVYTSANSDLGTIYKILNKDIVRHIDLPEDEGYGFNVTALTVRSNKNDVLNNNLPHFP